ncbi:MAG: type I restriction enzyme S subunit [Nitrospirae bacterium]|nr:MAG: type I restriction enzyme S subunit [Nitrospirota bacterium]
MSSFKKAIPKFWQFTTLDEIYQIVGGGTPSTDVAAYWGSGTPWVTSADIEGVRAICVRKYVTEIGIKESTTTKVPKKTLLVVTRVGLGKIAIAESPICFSQDLQGLIQSPNRICPEYTLYYLSYELQILKFEGRGTTISGITKKQLKDLGYPLPPFNEQKRIVAKIEELFSELDKGIESLKTAREQLKVYRQALLKHAFEGKLTAQWREENKDKLETADVLLKRIQAEREQRYQQQLKEWQKALKKWEAGGKKDKKPAKPSQPKYLPPLTPEELADLPQLPEGWAWAKIGNLSGKITDGEHFRPSVKDSGICFLSAKDVKDTGVAFDDPLYIDEDTAAKARLRCDPERNDILIVSRGATVGRMCIVNTDELFCLLGSVILIKVSRLLESKYVLYGLTCPQINRRIVSASGATAQQAIYLRDIQHVPIPLCSLAEQGEIIRAVEEKLTVVEVFENSINFALQQSEALRQSILKKAFSGQLVPQDPNDEPASVLLERIRAEREKETKKAGPKTARRGKA